MKTSHKPDIKMCTEPTERFLSEGSTPSKKKGTARCKIYGANGSSNGVTFDLEISYRRWNTGEISIAAENVVDGPTSLHRLEHGLSLSVYELNHDVSYCVLKQARIKFGTSNDWSNAYKATIEQLSSGSGVDIEKILKKSGAIAIGTREELLGDEGKARGYVCMTFKRDDPIPPIYAYFLTRVLPIINRYSA